MAASDRIPSDAELYDLSDKIGSDWYKLGFKLDLPYAIVCDINASQMPPCAYPRMMLEEWLKAHQNEKKGRLVQKLKDELQRCHRTDLSDDINFDDDFEDIFYKLMVPLVDEDVWEKLAVYLGFSMGQVGNFKKTNRSDHLTPSDCSLKLLSKWKDTKGKKATCTALIQAFESLQRGDLVLIVEATQVQDVQVQDTQPPGPVQDPIPDAESLGPSFGQMHIDGVDSLPGNQGALLTGIGMETENSAGKNAAPPPTTSSNNNEHKPTAISNIAQQPSAPATAASVDQPAGFQLMIHDPPMETESYSYLNKDFLWMSTEMERLRVESMPVKKDRHVHVALLDTGVYTDHPDLKGMIVKSKNFVSGEDDDLCVDYGSHGTHCAGILWQYGQDIIKIINLKVLNRRGGGRMDDIAEAMNYIKKWDKNNPSKKVEVIVLSLGQKAHHKDMAKLLNDFSVSKVIVCAASNAGEVEGDTIAFPANNGNVLAIGSCNYKGVKCDHSGVGPSLSFLFPGENIWSTSSEYYAHRHIPEKANNHRYQRKNGTSFAAPHAGALAALLLAYIESKSNKALRDKFANCRVMRNLFKRTIHNVGHTSEKGHGIPKVGEFTLHFIKDFIEKEFGIKLL